MMRTMDTPAQRLDALMDRRRLDLGHKWKAIAEEAGVTYQTLGQLRKGKPVADVTVARVERALRWSPGSIRAILAGGDPTPLGASPAGEDTPWDGKLVGPESPLLEDEELRWQDSGEDRLYRYTMDGNSLDATLGTDVPLEEAVQRLRRTWTQRLMELTGKMIGRPQGAPE